MKFLARYAKCFLICFVLILLYTFIAAWDEAGQIGFLNGSLLHQSANYFKYWLFWIVLYTGPFFLIVTVVLALLIFLVTLLYEFCIALLKRRWS